MVTGREIQSFRAKTKISGIIEMATSELKDSPETSAKQEDENVESKTSNDLREKLYHPEPKPLYLAPSSHDLKRVRVPLIMWSVVLALLPATVLAIYYFRMPAVRLIVTCVISTLLTELIIIRLKKQPVTINDGSSAITGLLLALTLPPTLPLSSAVLGSVFAIAIGKQVFGGLGYNIFNPALIGRAFLQASFPVAMTSWVLPFQNYDGVSAATPLGQFKFEKIASSLTPLLTGNTGGSLGETCSLALLAGGIFLLLMKFADWRIPAGFLGSVFIITGCFWLIDAENYASPLFHLFAGGLILGAFFMATDMVTSPITPLGSWIFGIGAGVLLVIIRLFGGLPEGVMYSILLMNAFTPLINRYTRLKYFGEVRR
jgi:electron transport complex protein RnfD